MKRTFFLALNILICSCFVLFSKQRTKPFELKMPDYKVENSLYNNVEFLDSRKSKNDLGYIQTGLLNNYAYLVDETPFPDQFRNLISQITDESSQGKTLLLQLRNLNFSEITKATSETGYCHIRISLYEKENESAYHFISTLDTLVVVKAMDVTGKLIKNASDIIVTFVADNLTKTPTDPQPFLLADIHNIDYYEKNHLRLYFTDTYKDGIYKNFGSLANQTPEIEEFDTKFKDNGELKEVKVLNNEKRKPEKIKPKEIYAVIADGLLYISTGKNYLPVFKDGDDFKFVNDGNVRINPTAYVGAGVAAGLMAGLLGVGVVPIVTSGPEKVVMTIDHMSGEFVVVPEENEEGKELL